MLNFKINARSMGRHLLKGTVSCALMLSLIFTAAPAESFAASKSPIQPKITKAVVVNSNTVKLQWSKAKNATKYKVYRKKADGKFVLVKTTATRTFQNKKLAYGTKYTYKVTAISKSGQKKTSKLKTVYTKPAKPVITAKVVNKNSVKLSWKATKGAVKYKVYRKKADGKFVLAKTTTQKTYESKALAYDTKYTYKVTAVSKAGKVNTSAVKAVTTSKKDSVVENKPALPEDPVSPETPDEPAAPVVQDCSILGHNYQMTKITSATCTENGYEEYKCSRCDETKTEIVAAMFGHNWAVTSSVDSTYTEEGCTWYKCSVCQSTKSESIPKKEQGQDPGSPETPAEPEAPAPSEPTTPSEPEQPAEKTVTVKIPIYEDDTVYWIKSYEGEIIYKSTNWEEWGAILDRPSIVIDGIEYDPRVTYGSGGETIIVGYDTLIMTENDWNESYYNGLPDVIVEYNN